MLSLHVFRTVHTALEHLLGNSIGFMLLAGSIIKLKPVRQALRVPECVMKLKCMLFLAIYLECCAEFLLFFLPAGLCQREAAKGLN